jgi:glutamate-ammonia-ligase adenylyltransferase
LSDLAQAIVAATLRIAERDAISQYGRLSGHAGSDTGLAILGYGSLGGSELGFASDLDLLFVYDGQLTQKDSCGPKILDGARYYARLAQRVVHLLTTLTRAGRLYEVDVRLRPDGSKGLLVTSLDAFADYQQERAWIWEHQALVRGRFIAGNANLGARFSAVRAAVLTQPRDPAKACREISAMRARWRNERDRSNSQQLDLKQGTGALLDIEFILQALVLLHSHRHSELLTSANSADLIALAAQVGAISTEQAQQLSEAHHSFLATALMCTLDAQARTAPRTPERQLLAEKVLRVASDLGLDFIHPEPSASGTADS